MGQDASREPAPSPQQGPGVLVGDCCGGATIMRAGDQPDFVGLVYIATFARDAGASPPAVPFG